jgi:alpha-tubulin suppressor-like RCC1 family protein
LNGRNVVTRAMTRSSLRMHLAAVALGAILLAQGCGDSYGNGSSNGTGPPPQATKVAFITQPDTGEGQVPWDPPPRVAVQDASGNTVTSASHDVTIRLITNPTGAALSGPITSRAVNGIATFTGLSVDLAGEGYVLEAESAGLTRAASAPFAIRTTFVRAAAGGVHACGLTMAGFAYCWGANFDGQLGDGTFSERLRPTPVTGSLRFAQLNAGAGYTCGVTTMGVAYCWGGNINGQLGDESFLPQNTPARVGGDVVFDQIAAGADHGCGVAADGSVYCWGRNDFGHLGDGSVLSRSRPTLVPGGLRFREVSAGGRHTCAVTTDSLAYCWGDNTHGQLGTGANGGSELSPVPVQGGLKVVHITAALAHTCGTTADSTAYCWGSPGFIGDGSEVVRPVPTPVARDAKYHHVSSMTRHTCAVTANNAAHCWGTNISGELGDSSMVRQLSPVTVAGELAFAHISAGNHYTCGVTANRVMYCWGRNLDGQLGDGTTVDRLTPAKVVQ